MKTILTKKTALELINHHVDLISELDQDKLINLKQYKFQLVNSMQKQLIEKCYVIDSNIDAGTFSPLELEWVNSQLNSENLDLASLNFKQLSLIASVLQEYATQFDLPRFDICGSSTNAFQSVFCDNNFSVRFLSKKIHNKMLLNFFTNQNTKIDLKKYTVANFNLEEEEENFVQFLYSEFQNLQIGNNDGFRYLLPNPEISLELENLTTVSKNCIKYHMYLTDTFNNMERFYINKNQFEFLLHGDLLKIENFGELQLLLLKQTTSVNIYLKNIIQCLNNDMIYINNINGNNGVGHFLSLSQDSIINILTFAYDIPLSTLQFLF